MGLSVYDVRRARKGIRAIMALSDTRPGRLPAITMEEVLFRQGFHAAESQRIYDDHRAERPRWILTLDSETRTIIGFMEGIGSIGDAAQLYSSALGRQVQVGIFEGSTVMGWFSTRANPIINALYELYRDTGYRKVELHGHSAGAAIMQVVALVTSNQRHWQDIVVYTSGSPKAGSSRFVEESRTQFRLFNFQVAYDAVCVIPPNEAEAEITAEARNFLLGRRADNLTPLELAALQIIWGQYRPFPLTVIQSGMVFPGVAAISRRETAGPGAGEIISRARRTVHTMDSYYEELGRVETAMGGFGAEQAEREAAGTGFDIAMSIMRQRPIMASQQPGPGVENFVMPAPERLRLEPLPIGAGPLSDEEQRQAIASRPGPADSVTVATRTGSLVRGYLRQEAGAGANQALVSTITKEIAGVKIPNDWLLVPMKTGDDQFTATFRIGGYSLGKFPTAAKAKAYCKRWQAFARFMDRSSEISSADFLTAVGIFLQAASSAPFDPPVNVVP